jgi:pimeloyl-ACP methyl ester carboxylesterase
VTLAARLNEFRRTSSPQRRTIGPLDWEYYRVGQGEQAVLLFPALGGDAEALFVYMAALAQDFVVIAPNLPPQVTQLDALLEGCRALLKSEQLPRGHVVGLSFGGALAQVFVRRFPDWVDDLVLVQTMIPNETTAARVQMQAQLTRWYPPPLLRWLNQRAMQQALRAIDTERAFWQAYYAEYYQKRWSRAQFLARLRWSRQYYGRSPFTTNDLQHWKGRVLMIEHEQDEIWEEGERGALQALYPRAALQTLQQGSHLQSLLDAEPLVASIRHFLLAVNT